MKLTEALELLKDPEALRIRAAELDGWRMIGHRDTPNIVTGEPVPLWTSPQIKFVKRTPNLPNYPENPATLSEAERRLGLHDRANVSLRVKWVNFLHDILAAQPDCPVNKVGNPLVSDIDKLLAPVEIRCLAFVMAAEWKAKQDGKGVAA